MVNRWSRHTVFGDMEPGRTPNFLVALTRLGWVEVGKRVRFGVAVGEGVGRLNAVGATHGIQPYGAGALFVLKCFPLKTSDVFDAVSHTALCI